MSEDVRQTQQDQTDAPSQQAQPPTGDYGQQMRQKLDERLLVFQNQQQQQQQQTEGDIRHQVQTQQQKDR